MARCPEGHEQRLGLKCALCGEELSYAAALDDLKKLPSVEPDYGKVAVVSVGYPRLGLGADYTGEVSMGQTDLRTSATFRLANVRGGNWLDLYNKYLPDLRRWMELVGLQKSRDRILVVDTTSLISVLAIAALPKQEHSAVVAIAADQDSTPVEQNTSYVAISLALKRNIPVVALTKTFEREMLYFDDMGLATKADALSKLVSSLLSADDDLMDLLERDLRLGVKVHCLSAIIAASKEVYGNATNAFMAQTYSISMGGKPEGYQTLHSLVFSRPDSQTEFEKSFGVFRTRKFKSALSAELRFHASTSPFYNMVTIYGMKNEASLQDVAEGYKAVVGSVPELNAGAVS